jgi:hypothetical protein
MYGFGQVEKINGKVKKLIETHSSFNYRQPLFTYNFDDKGNVTTIDGNDTAKYFNTYNESGKKSESMGYYFENVRKFKEIYKYNVNGYPITCIHTADNSAPDTDRFFYDKLGNLVEHQEYFKKKVFWITKIKYLYGKDSVRTSVEYALTEERNNFKTPSIYAIKFIVFDSKNNWIKSVDNLNDTITRKINYY